MLRPVLNSVWSFGGWGVSLTRPVLESVRRVRSLSYSFLIGIRPVVRQMGTFSCTPRPGIYLVVHLFDRFAGGESLLHAPCWNLSYTPCLGSCLVVRREESFSYMARSAVCLVVKGAGSFSYAFRLGIYLVLR